MRAASHLFTTLIRTPHDSYSSKNKKGGEPPFPNVRAKLTYLPAFAAAVFGAVPARFMLSILLSTDSMLVPVSTQAST